MKKLIVLMLAILLVPAVFGITLTTPADNTVSEIDTPELKWTDSLNSSFYNILVYRDDLLYNYTSTMKKFIVTQPWPEGEYQWKVIGTLLNGTKTESGLFAYTVNKTVDISGYVFDISTSTANYYVQDAIAIKLFAPAVTHVSLTVDGPTFTDNYETDVSEETEIIYVPSEPGQYTVSGEFVYQGSTVNRQIVLQVDARKPISCDIQTGNSHVVEKDSSFHSAVSNPSGSVSYKWDVFSDGSIESTSDILKYNFDTEGSKTIKLTVSDTYATASCVKTITVSSEYKNVIIRVVDEDDDAVSKARIYLDGDKKYANNDGEAVYNVLPGTYELNISKSGYLDYSKDIKIDDEDDIEIELTSAEDAPAPEITITAPPSGAKLKDDFVTVTFEVYSRIDVEACYVYYNLQSVDGWKVSNSLNSINDENSIRLTNLYSGRYNFQVRCENSERIEGESETRYFDVPDLGENNLPQAVDKIVEKEIELAKPRISAADARLAKLDDVKKELNSYTDERKRLYNSLGLAAKLSNAKAQMEILKSNYDNYVSMGLEEDILAEKETQMLEKLKSVEAGVPSSIVVESKSEFIYYPSEEEVSEVSQKYLELSKITLSERATEKYIETNFEFQKDFDITTKVTILKISYMDGNSQTYSLVEKTLPAEDYTDLVLIESFSKELAKNADEIIYVTPRMVLEQDPVIQFSLRDSATVSYFLPGSFSVDNSEQISSAIVKTQFNSNSITGFSVAGLKNISPTTIIIEVIFFILLLGGVTFAYAQGITKKDPEKELKSHLSQTFDLIKDRKKMEAFKKFDKMFELYSKVADERKTHFADMMEYLRIELEEHYLHTRLDKIQSHADTEEAKKSYEECLETYEALPEDKKLAMADRMNTVASIVERNSKVQLQDGTEVTIEEN